MPVGSPLASRWILPPWGVGSVSGNTRPRESDAVGPARMAVDSGEPDGVIAGCGIEIGPSGKHLLVPVVLVPTAASDPAARLSLPRSLANLVDHFVFRRRADEIDASETGPESVHVPVGIDEPWVDR